MRNTMNINAGWVFAQGVSEVPAKLPQTWEAISLPHTWNAEDGQDGGNDYYRGTCCYAKAFRKAELPEGDCHYLEIRGANSSADVYLNGTHLAHHDGGYSTFRAKLTGALEAENLLVILVDNAPNDHVYPQTADFTFYGGLYRDVKIIAVSKAHFDLDYYGGCGLTVTPVIEGGNAQVDIRVYPVGLEAGDVVGCRILRADGSVAAAEMAQDGYAKAEIADVHLWDGVRDPYLYTAEASILRAGQVIDKVCVRFGCRSFSVDPQKGFILNGREYPLRGVSRHQDRLGVGNALLPEHHREDMDLICEMGANTIRLAHYQHDQYFYDLCDERGMAVWAEIPYISSHLAAGCENAEQQMRELIVQNHHHPSIVVWGLSNEITMDGARERGMIENHRRLNALVHEMDASRLTTLACITMCGMDEEIVHIADVVSYKGKFCRRM